MKRVPVNVGVSGVSRTMLRVALAPIAFLVVWTFTAPLFDLPGIAAIAAAIVEMIRAGTFFHDVMISAYRGLSGFLIGYLLGALTGLLTGRFNAVFLALGGMLNFLRWTPVLALLPISIRIGGLGEAPKIFLIAWACFFVAWIYTHTAVCKLSQSYLMWSDSLGLGLKDRLVKVFAPAVAPAMVGGARAGLALAIIVVVAAELGGTSNYGFFRDGLGYRISRAIETNRNDINIACIVTLGALGVVLDLLLVLFVKRGLKRLTGMDFYRDDA